MVLHPTSTADGGTVEDSIVPAGCAVAGQVLRTVLANDVEVGRGVQVTESVVLPGAVIGAGSRLRGVIVDSGYRVPEGTVIERFGGIGDPPVLSRYHDEMARHATTR
jgi:glucose-1-phosphate adenylyltransferase